VDAGQDLRGELTHDDDEEAGEQAVLDECALDEAAHLLLDPGGLDRSALGVDEDQHHHEDLPAHQEAFDVVALAAFSRNGLRHRVRVPLRLHVDLLQFDQ